jgi:prepilin-type processing-associated H-X9-DG protein
LIELLVVVAVIGVLAGLLMPALGRAKEAGRATACLGHLRQVGLALQMYVDDHGQRLPVMRDRVPPEGGDGATNLPPVLTDALPSPDLVLSNYVGDVRVLRCPSDRLKVFEATGSSYSWNSLLNGQAGDRLKVMGIEFETHQVPVFFDKEAFHRARGEKKGVNYLYADGHIRNLLVLEGTR